MHAGNWEPAVPSSDRASPKWHAADSSLLGDLGVCRRDCPVSTANRFASTCKHGDLDLSIGKTDGIPWLSGEKQQPSLKDYPSHGELEQAIRLSASPA